MKRKVAVVLTALLLVGLLPGCGSVISGIMGLNRSDSPAEDDQSNSEATEEVCVVGDTIRTDFFAWSVDSVRTEQTYDGYTAAEGMKLVVAELSIRNTENYSMPMLPDDFQIQWGDGDEDYGYPASGSFATEYEIPIGQTATGDLAFEVPADAKDCAIAFLEIYEDDSEGNSYFVYFTV